MTNEGVRIQLVSLHDLRTALAAAHEALPDHDLIGQCLVQLDEIIDFVPGDLVECRVDDDKWQPGVVVALMVCAPRYICRAGDDRNADLPAYTYGRGRIRRRGGES